MGVRWSSTSGSMRAKLRRGWQAQLDAGALVVCRRCGHAILPHHQWDLGHRVDLALGGEVDDVAPEYRRCNTRAGSLLGHRLRAGQGAHSEHPDPPRMDAAYADSVTITAPLGKLW